MHLANARRAYPALTERAEREAWSFHELLLALAREEVAHRAETRLRRCVRKARFPLLKTVEEFDFSVQPELRRSLLGSCFSPEFVTQGRNLILTGRSVRGETHLAAAIAYKAIQNGFDAFFASAAALIDDLSSCASREGRFVDALKAYVRPAEQVVDDLGYLSYGPDAAKVLFHVVNARCLQRRSLLFTTDKPLKDWGAALHDYDLAEAAHYVGRNAYADYRMVELDDGGRMLDVSGVESRGIPAGISQIIPAAGGGVFPDYL